MVIRKVAEPARAPQLAVRLTAMALAAVGWACAPPEPREPEPEPAATDVETAAPAAPDRPMTPEPIAEPADAPSEVRLGIDVLLSDSLHLVRGRRVGLITNHTGLSWREDAAISTIDRLHRHPDIQLVALFSPEHGIRGAAEAGEKVSSELDRATGLPIHSLYGETRAPTSAMLRDLDVLLFDIQDIGARYYTYVWTMALAMTAAGQNDVEFVVLDRPNPIGGRLVQGNMLDPEYATFVGLYPVAMRHGLTAGEVARLVRAEHGVDVNLAVVPMRGWERRMWYDDTGLPWVAPSPSMPSLESATHYPGTCLFEGTNLSVGRGTPAAFQHIGAPWLDAERLAERLNERVARGELAGARFEPVTFTPSSPGDAKFGGEQVRGVRFHATDRTAYDPIRAAVAALIEIHRLHADRLEWRVSHFDRLAGTDALRRRIVEGASLEEATEGWAAQTAAFEALRRPILLYR